MRVETGVFGLDSLLGGGLRKNTVTVVLGSTGTGKTIFTLQFLMKGLEKGENGIYVSFDMDEKGVLDTALSLGWDEVKEYIEDERLKVRRFFAENVSYLNNELMSFIMSGSDGNSRIVIDSFTPLVSSLSYEMRNDVNWFFYKLRSLGTTVITLEEPLSGNLDEPSVTIPLFLGDTVVQLKNIGYGEAFNRTLRIIKHRGSWHAEGVFPYRILDGVGIVVEGVDYIEERREKVDIDSLIKKMGVRVPQTLYKKLKKMCDSGVAGTEEAVKTILESLK